MIKTQEIKFPPCGNPKVPAPSAEFRHVLPVQVRFADIDVFGHINNGAYLSYLDLGKTTYMTEVIGSRVEAGGMAAVIVNINCSFYSPGYFDEPLAVGTMVTSISQHSYTVEQRVVNTETGDVKCVARTVLVGFDAATAVGIEIPSEVADRMEAFEQRQLRGL
ncbi:MAG: acyl-CoA thioesterase [Muribaculaceae bacterium]|nr:acyl-CoA thioesterase [Muribaculaceae bacterium]